MSTPIVFDAGELVSEELDLSIAEAPDSTELVEEGAESALVSSGPNEDLIVFDVRNDTTVLSGGEQGPPGPPAPPGSSDQNLVGIASMAMSGHRVVYLDFDGKFRYADCATLAHAARPLAVTVMAANQGDEITAMTFGRVTESSWSWEPEVPVYLSTNGFLTQIPPLAPAARFLAIVGLPTSPTTLFVAPRLPTLIQE